MVVFLYNLFTTDKVQGVPVKKESMPNNLGEGAAPAPAPKPAAPKVSPKAKAKDDE